MTVDELLKKVNDGWGWATFEISRTGDGKWTAYFQCVEVRDGEKEIEQPFHKADTASDAVTRLVQWLRGKKLRHRGVNGGVSGSTVNVPVNLEVPVIS